MFPLHKWEHPIKWVQNFLLKSLLYPLYPLYPLYFINYVCVRAHVHAHTHARTRTGVSELGWELGTVGTLSALTNRRFHVELPRSDSAPPLTSTANSATMPPMLTRLRPLRDRVIVRPLDPPKLGLIDVIRPGAKWARGEVLAVGPGKRGKDGVARPWGTAVGDVVQFTDVMTYPSFDDVLGRVLVIQEADICGIEEGNTMQQVLEDAGAA